MHAYTLFLVHDSIQFRGQTRTWTPDLPRVQVMHAEIRRFFGRRRLGTPVGTRLGAGQQRDRSSCTTESWFGHVQFTGENRIAESAHDISWHRWFTSHCNRYGVCCWDGQRAQGNEKVCLYVCVSMCEVYVCVNACNTQVLVYACASCSSQTTRCVCKRM